MGTARQRIFAAIRRALVLAGGVFVGMLAVVPAADVDPPAPFIGSATFERRPGGRSAWRGSLRVPVLGGAPSRLTGGDFQAQLIKGSPFDRAPRHRADRYGAGAWSSRTQRS